jgi:hypothetical protein
MFALNFGRRKKGSVVKQVCRGCEKVERVRCRFVLEEVRQSDRTWGM